MSPAPFVKKNKTKQKPEPAGRRTVKLDEDASPLPPFALALSDELAQPSSTTTLRLLSPRLREPLHHDLHFDNNGNGPPHFSDLFCHFEKKEEKVCRCRRNRVTTRRPPPPKFLEGNEGKSRNAASAPAGGRSYSVSAGRHPSDLHPTSTRGR